MLIAMLNKIRLSKGPCLIPGLCLILWLSGAASPGQAPRAVAVAVEAPANYLLVPDDLVRVKVFQEDDLDSTLRVSKDGTITFPLIGLVHVGGKSPQDAADLIRAELARDYLVNPQVTMTVMEYAKRHFTVLGQVQRPGSYDLPDREAVTLLQAIGMAGGYTRIADPSKITCKRRAEDKEVILKLNGKSMASGKSSSGFEIQPGDVITVGESMF